MKKKKPITTMHYLTMIHNEILTYHLQNHSICITIGHHPSKRAPTGHAEAARIVNNDQVSSTFLDEFC